MTNVQTRRDVLWRVIWALATGIALTLALVEQ